MEGIEKRRQQLTGPDGAAHGRLSMVWLSELERTDVADYF